MSILDVPLELVSKNIFRVWGGDLLKGPNEPYGERVDISDDLLVKSGKLKGLSVKEIAKNYKLYDQEEFPLILKLIDAKSNLSLQVHPSKVENKPWGKDEAWYILKSGDIHIGLKDVNKPPSIDNTHVITPPVGSVVVVPAGTVHAITGGMRVLEWQQNCDITYRIYDWGRGRKLDMDLAINSIKQTKYGISNPTIASYANCQQEFFDLDFMKILKLSKMTSEISMRFDNLLVLTALGGSVKIFAHEEFVINDLSSLLIPKECGFLIKSVQDSLVISLWE